MLLERRSENEEMEVKSYTEDTEAEHRGRREEEGFIEN
jgi:hypothetical protein